MYDSAFVKKVVISVLVILVLLATMMLVFQSNQRQDIYKTIEKIYTAPTSPQEKNYLQQRNALSRELNEQKKIFGQASCEMIQLRKKAGEKIDQDVSTNGGWCEKMSGPNSASHMFDESFAKALSKYLTGKHVASFGDGPGAYKKALDSYKQVASYTAYDGAPYCEKTTDGKVKFLDLSGPQYGLRAYDWVVSIEVGEHIPAKYENIFLDNLARHAKEGVVLSWAVPGQGGLSHVNNQPLDHVVEQMKKRGFNIDKTASEPLKQEAKFGWLKGNTYVYKRADPNSFHADDV